jgi:ankyrin repeat protein
MKGETMKILIQRLTGEPPRRFGTLDGLTREQLITRVEWFLEILRNNYLIPTNLEVNPAFFIQHSTDHVYPVLWQLIRNDVCMLWEIAPYFQTSSPSSTVILSYPLTDGPSIIVNRAVKFEPFYKSANTGKIISLRNFKRATEAVNLKPERIMIDLVNKQLKIVPEGKRLKITSLEELADSRILCCLVNSFVPGTFTTEVLLNDRWTINLTLISMAKFFKIESNLNTTDIKNGNFMGSCGFLVFLFISGYQFIQARVVLDRIEEIIKEQSKLQQAIQKKSNEKISTPKELKIKTKDISVLKSKLQHLTDELYWVTNTYNVDQCKNLMESAMNIQAEICQFIMKQMKKRFDIIIVPPSRSGVTINDLCEIYCINLSLTSGNGFYLGDLKEALWPGRRLVVKDTKTDLFYDDFSGVECPKDNIRGMLDLHPTEIVHVACFEYPHYELYFESTSRNKVLRSGSKFLYQVFPGTLSQCQQLLRLSAKRGDMKTLQKLINFFKLDKSFVNSSDDSGNTALHLASRHGHFEVALYLLNSQADVNTCNSTGCTPFFLSVEGFHAKICQLLIEWGADITICNRRNKTAIEVTRSVDLKKTIEKKYSEHMELVKKIRKGNKEFLRGAVQKHFEDSSTVGSLTCRCVDGLTLLHWSVKLSMVDLTKVLIDNNVDVNITGSNGSTPLHFVRHPDLVNILIDNRAALDITDTSDNTPLHIACLQKHDNSENIIKSLVEAGSDLSIGNVDGYLPIHCAIMTGHTVNILELLYQENMFENNANGLMIHALNHGNVSCANWLASKGIILDDNELSSFSELLITQKLSQVK